MEKIDKTIEVMEGRDARGTKIELNRRKINEIVEWINEHEKIMIKDRDWLLARLKIIEEEAKKHQK